MDLLEREALQNALNRARLVHGSTILVSGEAGVGKTSFIADSTAPYRSAGLVFWGACDPLFTPRPLGPLYEIALQMLSSIWLLGRYRSVSKPVRSAIQSMERPIFMCRGD